MGQSALLKYWPLIVPIILNISDDYDPGIKSKGNQLIGDLAQRAGNAFVKNTGLVPVFIDALVPSFSYLPPGVEPSISIVVTQSAIKSLIELTKVESDEVKRLKILSKIVTDGIIRGIAHGANHIELTISFLKSMISIMPLMESNIIRHMSAFVKVFVNILSDPFIDLSPKLVIVTANCMLSIMSYAWVRVPEYKYDILRGISAAWIRLENGSIKGEDVTNAKDILSRLTATLKDCVGDMKDDWDALIREKPELIKLHG